MLSKLIKYDLKYIYKQLFIFYIIVLLTAITARLTNFETNSFIIIFIHEFAQGCAYGFSFGMFINASMRIWARFRQNLYGDESYLTHTLPVTRHTLWSAKFLTSLLVILISGLTFLIAFLIINFSDQFIREWGLNDPDVIKFCIIFLFAAYFQITYIVQSGFTGILVGHRYNNSHILHSVIWGLATYFAGMVILIGLTLLWSLFNPDIHRMLFNGIITGASQFNQLITGFAIIYFTLILATYFINSKLLAKGVDVD